MQVYLPDGMYQQVKARGLPVSELLQKAVQAGLRRLDLLAGTERYLKDLIADDLRYPTRSEVVEVTSAGHENRRQGASPIPERQRLQRPVHGRPRRHSRHTQTKPSLMERSCSLAAEYHARSRSP